MVYGQMLREFRQVLQAGDLQRRDWLLNLIDGFEKLFPAECKVWQDRYPANG
jgi:hypothetical protein